MVPSPAAVSLTPMTRELMHQYYRSFVPDPDIYMDPEKCVPYVYDPPRVDAHFDDRTARPGYLSFAVLLDGQVIGDGVLKHIDPEKKECEMGIHLTNDSVKNRGYGTQAERLILRYAFEELGMNAVLADSVLKNTRSQHILEKLGFQFLSQDDTFRYYRLTKSDYETLRLPR